MAIVNSFLTLVLFLCCVPVPKEGNGQSYVVDVAMRRVRVEGG